MFKHIVMWKMKEKAEGRSKLDNIKEMKKRILQLPSQIKQIEIYEVGIDELQGPTSSDICLISAFNSKEDFQIYRDHPKHRQVVEFINKITSSRTVIDYQS
ncbi:MAG: Dabb family protein [Caldithrix sp.]|nr:Dabb family protein [Caldithrix sp.]